MKAGFIIPVFVIALATLSCNSYNKLLKSANYELKLQKADEYFAKRNYIRASQLYEELIPYVKGTDRSERVYYQYSLSEYYLGDYILSQYHFKNYTRQYPAGQHVEQCLFLNAYCYYLNSPNYQLDQAYTRNAIKEFQNFADQFPESHRIDSCNLMIDQLRGKIERKEYEIIKQYYRLDDWKATIVASKNYIKEYPTSLYHEELYYLMIDSYYLLAINSVISKRDERLNGAIENYVKFVDLYPKSSYISRAENVYKNCQRLLIKQ